MIPVAWTPEETVLFAATNQPDVRFVGLATIVETPLDQEMDDGTRFRFLTVARQDGVSEVGFELRDASGRVLGHTGPLLMDRTD